MVAPETNLTPIIKEIFIWLFPIHKLFVGRKADSRNSIVQPNWLKSIIPFIINSGSESAEDSLTGPALQPELFNASGNQIM